MNTDKAILNKKFTYIPKDKRATSKTLTYFFVLAYSAMIFFVLGMAMVLSEKIDFLQLKNLPINEWRYLVYVCGAIGLAKFTSVIRSAREERLFLSEVKDELDKAHSDLEIVQEQNRELKAKYALLEKELDKEPLEEQNTRQNLNFSAESQRVTVLASKYLSKNSDLYLPRFGRFSCFEKPS